MIIKDLKYSYSDLTIIPAVVSNIKSRSECIPYYFNEELPIFTAPMEGVCDDKNYKVFRREGIIPIIHRNIDITKRTELLANGQWIALSLSEFKYYFIDNPEHLKKEKIYSVCIDIANGHMQYLFDLVVEAKQIAKNLGFTLVLMAGNIANPETYEHYSLCGIDYVRCSIGTGSQCLTTSNTAIHYPNASLINEIYLIKEKLKRKGYFTPKIIADGGMGNTEEAFSRSIIALALGADYVMIGGAFSSFIESAAKIKSGYYSYNNDNKIDLWAVGTKLKTNQIPDSNEFKQAKEINSEFLKSKNILVDDRCVTNLISFEQIYNDIELAQFIVDNYVIQKESFGMSTKQAQENNPNFNGKYKTSEGKSIIINVKYTCHSWVENFKSYLKSTMSYCNAKTLQDFIGNQKLCVKSIGTINSVNK